MLRMPSVFIGHGTPMHALADNQWTQTWNRLGRAIGRPRAILVISAHWCTEGTHITAMANPPTIHDFGGAHQRLFDVQYPAPGDPELAAHIRAVLAPLKVELDQSWGLDHGTWAVLCKSYPDADVPVLQLSIDIRQDAAFHFEAGKLLAQLRDEGILIMGTGNVVHNLRAFRRFDDDFAYDWAVQFNDFVRDSLLARDYTALVNYEDLGIPASLSVPTPDHYYPLLYAAGAGGNDIPTIESDGVFQASMSMLSVAFGLSKPEGR